MADKKTLRKRPKDDNDDVEAKVPKIDNSSKKLQPSISKNKQLIKCWGWGRCDTMLDPTSPKFKEFTCECKFNDSKYGCKNIYTSNVLNKNISRHYCDECWKKRNACYNEYDIDDDSDDEKRKRKKIAAKCTQCYKYYYINRDKKIKEAIEKAIKWQRINCHNCEILLDPLKKFLKNRCSCDIRSGRMLYTTCHKYFCDECYSEYRYVAVNGEMDDDDIYYSIERQFCNRCHKTAIINKHFFDRNDNIKEIEKQRLIQQAVKYSTKCYQCEILLDPHSNTFLKNRCYIKIQERPRVKKVRHFCDECWGKFNDKIWKFVPILGQIRE